MNMIDILLIYMGSSGPWATVWSMKLIDKNLPVQSVSTYDDIVGYLIMPFKWYREGAKLKMVSSRF